ncbi:MAG: DUF1993 domain-containing protein [Myxococcales bacterium]|nr:DUF1993 domain-containing protein [Myxococcales bacterium]
MTPIERTRNTFTTRLGVLDALLKKGLAHWTAQGGEADALLGLRLADDMYPLAHQVAFACEQARQLAAFWIGEELAPLDPAGWTLADAHAAIADAQARLAGIDVADLAPLARTKHRTLQGGMYLELSGEDYLADWMMPNFHFHLVTAYAILRHHGTVIGKADYMAHLMPFVRAPKR